MFGTNHSTAFKYIFSTNSIFPIVPKYFSKCSHSDNFKYFKLLETIEIWSIWEIARGHTLLRERAN